jgi:hypothetical protein
MHNATVPDASFAYDRTRINLVDTIVVPESRAWVRAEQDGVWTEEITRHTQDAPGDNV